MNRERWATGCVVIFWTVCLLVWWLTQNAPGVLAALFGGAVVVSVSAFVYAIARTIQELARDDD